MPSLDLLVARSRRWKMERSHPLRIVYILWRCAQRNSGSPQILAHCKHAIRLSYSPFRQVSSYAARYEEVGAESADNYGNVEFPSNLNGCVGFSLSPKGQNDVGFKAPYMRLNHMAARHAIYGASDCGESGIFQVTNLDVTWREVQIHAVVARREKPGKPRCGEKLQRAHNIDIGVPLQTANGAMHRRFPGAVPRSWGKLALQR